MSGELRDAVRGAVGRVDPAERRVSTPESDGMLTRLGGADYVSLTALLVGWGAVLLLVGGEANWGLLAMFGAFGLDKLDGWYARKTGTASPFGREVDSFIDVFVYLVPAAVLYHVAMAPHPIASLLVGFPVLAFGGLRLIRHSTEGFGSDGDVSYYHGTTVVHTNLVVVGNYLLATTVPAWNGWLAGLTILLACPAMISDYKSYKTTVGHVLAGTLVVLAGGLALGLELGVIGA